MTQTAYKLDVGAEIGAGTAFMKEYIPKYWHLGPTYKNDLLESRIAALESENKQPSNHCSESR